MRATVDVCGFSFWLCCPKGLELPFQKKTSSNRACSYQQTPHKSYKPKQSEWMVERDRNYGRRHSGGGYHLRASSEPPAEPLYRRTFTIPTSTGRVENYFRYWHGRASGLDYIAPFLGREDWRPAEVSTLYRLIKAMFRIAAITESSGLPSSSTSLRPVVTLPNSCFPPINHWNENDIL